MLFFSIEPLAQDFPAREIIEFAEMRAVTEHILKEYIITALLEDTNVLARICEETARVGQSLRAAALRDLEALMASIASASPLLSGYVPSVRRRMHFTEYQQSLEAIVSAETCEKMLEGILSHYRTFGGGKNAKYIAFLWDKGLRGIESPDAISMDQLFCLSDQKRQLIDNTQAFLSGRPANNVLLYGNSGCGKSSMVKAILSAYYRDGLRLVQAPKDSLPELPLLLRQIREKRFRYILFLDDLSFESDDIGYKTLKTILDGGIEPQPDNILFYATSNRLHLINETWAERKGDDVHVTDTRNEKMSLSERFGIRISFLSPDQREYLDMLEGILAGKGVALTDAMRAEAVQWAWQCNGLSGRTATQYAATILANSPLC